MELIARKIEIRTEGGPAVFNRKCVMPTEVTRTEVNLGGG